MDLISRKAAIDAIRAWAEQPVIRKSRGFEPKGKAIVLDMIGVVTEQPSVPAVPMDKLCLLLHDIAGCPCYTQQGEDMCNRIIGDQCNTEWDDIECWKRFLTKWMEGQDGTDNT